MATIKFSEFTRATDPTGFDVAGLQDGTNKIIDSSLIGDGKYVPYESDGKSVAALDGGALMIGEHDIAKVVPAEGDLTNMADYESLLGINVNGMQIEWNGNLPFTPPSIVLFAASITLFEDPDTGYALYVVANAEELGFPSGSFIFMYSSEMNSVLPIYVNGNFESAMLVVGFPVPEYTQGWNTQITKFSTDLRYSPSELRGDLTSTDTYWNLDKAFIGYPEPDRIEIGDGENPVKILHLEGERVIEAEVDAIGEITAEHTLARTSDIPTDQHIEEIVRKIMKDALM